MEIDQWISNKFSAERSTYRMQLWKYKSILSKRSKGPRTLLGKNWPVQFSLGLCWHLRFVIHGCNGLGTFCSPGCSHIFGHSCDRRRDYPCLRDFRFSSRIGTCCWCCPCPGRIWGINFWFRNIWCTCTFDLKSCTYGIKTCTLGLKSCISGL